MTKKHMEERKSGAETSMERRSPVMIGATTPATRDRALAIPVAVPRVRVGKVCGVTAYKTASVGLAEISICHMTFSKTVQLTHQCRG